MEQNNLLFLQVLNNSLNINSNKLNNLTDTEWMFLYNKSVQNNLTAVMYYAVKDINAETEASAKIKTLWKKNAQMHCVRQTIIYSKLAELLDCFDKNGVTVAVLKGPALAVYYPDASARISGDIDLYLPNKNQCEKATALLNNYPASVCDSIAKDSAAYTIDNILHIEIHFSAFKEENGKFFEDFSALGYFGEQTLCKADILDIKMLLPLPDQMLVYLVCHMAQHFVFSGFGIRHIIDFMLFLSHNLQNFNLKETEEVLKKLGLYKFYLSCIQICIKYFSFTQYPHPFPSDFDKNLAENLLFDIMEAGVYGYSTDERMQSGAVVLNAYVNGESEPSFLRKLFPKYSKMAQRYPYCKKYPFLLPIAYINRFISYKNKSGKNMGEMAKTAGAVSDISRERIELLKNLDMLN